MQSDVLLAIGEFSQCIVLQKMEDREANFLLDKTLIFPYLKELGPVFHNSPTKPRYEVVVRILELKPV